MVRVINLETGEVAEFNGKMMVASNGVIFIKHNKDTLWASGSDLFEVTQVSK